MKPLRLEFCGINSFSEKTVIDFEKLTKNGIFGIFGDTGSGKSTILDSINFALYGDVDRSKEKTDIINYRSDALEVKFTFEITHEGERKVYTVERSLKKNKSGTHKASLYDDSKNLSIADNATSVKNKIISIIGLEAEDFRKCIALPQGEFSQFVKSQTSERIKLIERLFSLSKYGIKLREKLFVKEKAVDEAYNELVGKLSVFNDVNNELLESTMLDINTSKSLISQENINVEQANKQFELVKNLYDKKCELDLVRKKLLELKDSKSDIDELKRSVSLIEGAKLCIKINEEICDKINLVSNLIKEINKYEKDKEDYKKALSLVQNKIDNGNFDENISKSSMLLGKFETISDLPKKLESVKTKLFELRKAYGTIKSNLDIIKEEYANLIKEAESLSLKINSIAVDDIETFVKTKFKDVILKEEYSKQINIYADLRSDIKTFEDGSELYKYVKKRFDEQIKLYGQRILQVKDVCSTKIFNQLKSLKENLDKKEELNLKLSKIKSKISRLEAEIKNGETELNRIQKEGEEIAAEKADIAFRLKEVFGKDSVDFSLLIENEKLRFKELNAQKQFLFNQKSELEEKLKLCEIAISGFNSQKNSVEFELLKLKDDLSQNLNKLKFNSVDECKKLILQFGKFSSSAEDSISEYEKKLAVAENKEKELLKFEGIDKVCEEDVNCALKAKIQTDENLKNLSSRLAVLQKTYNDLLQRLNTKNELLKDLDKISAERNVVYQLKDLIKNNKFMEFIANEYLFEISSLASGTLLKLTCGRYFLTYKDNFYVGDNYDCGNLRGVNTLSGGETFLVSLSLALALSSTICAKALKSIEFFFLDEGFGTLDETLIDTVMDALEKLKSEQFTIGIISHVEELKHRIDSKITVNKATESHGSTVQISC